MYRFLAEIGSENRPIFRIFHQKRGDQAQIRVWIREESDNLYSPLYLLVEPLQHVGRSDLSGIELREGISCMRMG